MHRTIIGAMGAVALCVAATAHAQTLPYKSTLPHRHASMSYVGSSKPISDAHAACLKPVNSALYSGLHILTTLNPVGAYNAEKPNPDLQPTDKLVAEMRGMIEKTDWIEQPAAALRAQRENALARQKHAYQWLTISVGAYGEFLAARKHLQQDISNLGNSAGEQQAQRERLMKRINDLDALIPKLQEESLKQAALAKLFDAIVGYCDCELARLSAGSK